MAYWILLLLYLILVLLYAYHYRQPTIQAWPLLPKTVDAPAKPTSCQDTKECPPYHVCLNQKCVPQLLRGEECYEETGDWTLTAYRGKDFAACICKNPNVVDQKHFGGNCDQDVACRPHGYYNLQTKQCVCNQGFKADGLKCLSLLAIEQMNLEPCDFDELEFKDLIVGHGLTTSYISKNTNKKCFKRPCTFDAWTGKFLKKARYEKGVGCICDPSLGQFGVRLEGLDSYTRDNGYNACVSVFETPLENPIFVQIFAYFYLMQRPPLVFIQYSNVMPSDVIEPLRSLIKNNALQIGQEFPYDYLQTHLRNREPFVAQISTIKFDKNFYMHSYITKVTVQHGEKLVSDPMDWCRYMSRHLKRNKINEWSFNLLNQFPMCYVGKNDDQAPEQYRGRYVLNPFQLLHKDSKQNLNRTNAVVFAFENGQWVLSLTDGYAVDTYHWAANGSFIPDVSDDPVASILQSKGVATWKEFNEVTKLYEDAYDEIVANQEPIFEKIR
ncbi:hypothetical protein AVEN_257694-1 [Araneus ventricosus]|uniref:EGF-like domain-containing protein n=1 Tax=Araneus ventricosus TaxID=182803 RepID=A0A4Y2LEZ3_ARAVE|nr:hypothetical protein AVEN_257694-1 [Araneus ventricosus]